MSDDERILNITWSDPMPPLEKSRGMAGVDYLRAIADGSVPAPPIARLLGMGMESVEEGVVTFTLDPHESHYNPLGVVHGGVLATVLDTVLGCAVHSMLPAGWGYTSIDLNVSYLKAVRVDSGTLRFTGRVLKHGRRVSFATADGVDGSGAVVATATSSLLVMAPA